ncbi:MAG: nitrogen regulation protein NR(II) [Steroidobacteraceae bacterium]
MAAGRLDHAELLDALTTGVVLLDGHFNVIHANVAAQGLLAMSLNKAHGKPFIDWFADANGLPAMLRRASEHAEVIAEREVIVRTVAAPRDARVFDVTVTPLDGAVAGRDLLLEFSDATQRRRLNRDSELRARLDGSRLMTRQLAHEIKNPIGGLRGAAQLLERELPERAQREYTRIIIAEADRLTALVDNMSGSARPPQKQLLNVHEVCEHVFRLLTAEAKAGVRVERDYDPSVPEGCFDRNQLVQALLNLARNALQAVGDAGRIVLRTRAVTNSHIGARRERLAVRIDVIDDGPGVPEEIRGSLFLPLVTARPNGTGLGLAVAQEMIHRNGGAIEYASEPGNTVFSVLLPL